MGFQNVCYGIVCILVKLREMLSNFQSIGRNVGNFAQEERFKSEMRNLETIDGCHREQAQFGQTATGKHTRREGKKRDESPCVTGLIASAAEIYPRIREDNGMQRKIFERTSVKFRLPLSGHLLNNSSKHS